VEPSSIQLQTNSMTIRTGRFMPVVTLTVRTTNNPPVAMEDAYTVQENNPLNVLAPGVLVNDTDPDGDPLQAEVVGWPYADSFDFSTDGRFFDHSQGTLDVPAPGVLANDYDPVVFDAVHVDGLVSPPGNGDVTLRTDGSFSYTPVRASSERTASATVPPTLSPETSRS